MRGIRFSAALAAVAFLVLAPVASVAGGGATLAGACRISDGVIRFGSAIGGIPTSTTWTFDASLECNTSVDGGPPELLAGELSVGRYGFAPATAYRMACEASISWGSAIAAFNEPTPGGVTAWKFEFVVYHAGAYAQADSVVTKVGTIEDGSFVALADGADGSGALAEFVFTTSTPERCMDGTLTEGDVEGANQFTVEY